MVETTRIRFISDLFPHIDKAWIGSENIRFHAFFLLLTHAMYKSDLCHIWGKKLKLGHLSQPKPTSIHGTLKLWCLLTRLMWPLTVYEVPVTRVERLERTVSSSKRRVDCSIVSEVSACTGTVVWNCLFNARCKRHGNVKWCPLMYQH